MFTFKQDSSAKELTVVIDGIGLIDGDEILSVEDKPILDDTRKFLIGKINQVGRVVLPFSSVYFKILNVTSVNFYDEKNTHQCLGVFISPNTINEDKHYLVNLQPLPSEFKDYVGSVTTDIECKLPKIFNALFSRDFVHQTKINIALYQDRVVFS